MVEHNLAMVRVASSNLVSRSKGRVSKAVIQRIANSYSPVRLWNAPPQTSRPGGEIGRHKGLKIPRTLKVRTGSTPVPGTINSPFESPSKIEKPNKYYSENLNFFKNQQDKTFYQKFDVNHNFDKNFADFYSKNPVNNKNSDASYEKSGLISYCGCLGKNHLKLNLSPTKKIFLSCLVGLCCSKFAKANSYAINLSDLQIADRLPDFSPRQVSRHLADLEKAGVLRIRYADSKRWISIADLNLNKGKLPIVYISTSDFTLTASQTLVLSRLLDKAAFYARSGLGFIVDHSQMRSLLSDLYPMSERTIRAALQQLKAYGLISYVEEGRSAWMPIVFKSRLIAEYSDKFKITTTSKCQDIVKMRALRQLQIHTADAGSITQDPTAAVKPDPNAAQAANKVHKLTSEHIKNILIFQAINLSAKNGSGDIRLSAKKGKRPKSQSAKKDSPLYVKKHDQVDKHFVYKHAGGGGNISMQQGNLKLNSIGRYEIGDRDVDPENYFEFTCGSALEVCLNGIWVPTRFECGVEGYYLSGLKRIAINGLKARRNA